MRLLFFIFLSFALGPSAFAATPTPGELLCNWRDALYSERETSLLRMTITPKDGDEITREARVFYQGVKNEDTKILMKFTSPARIKGTAFLSLKQAGEKLSDQWIFFPAYSKARRLSSRSKDDSFLDSDFSNGDISSEYLRDFTFSVTGAAMIDGQKVHVLVGQRNAGSASAYSKQVLYVTQDSNLNLKSEFFDQQGTLFKRLTLGKWRRLGNKWATDWALMENLRTGGETRLEILKRDTATSIPAQTFTVVHLERGL